MLNIFKYTNYALKAKKGINHSDEFIQDVSFSPIESFFILSFIILGLITLGLGFLAFYYTSNIALFFAILFLTVLSVDIWVFIKVKKFFARMSANIVNYSKKKYKKYRELNVDTIIDVDLE